MAIFPLGYLLAVLHTWKELGTAEKSLPCSKQVLEPHCSQPAVATVSKQKETRANSGSCTAHVMGPEAETTLELKRSFILFAFLVFTAANIKGWFTAQTNKHIKYQTLQNSCCLTRRTTLQGHFH